MTDTQEPSIEPHDTSLETMAHPPEPAPKRPRREEDEATTAGSGCGIALGPLLYYPQGQEAGPGSSGSGGAAALFPSLRHTDPECHVR